MRVVICSDHWDHLPAGDITAAIGRGWRDRRPETTVVQLPFSSGGAGFVTALARSLDAHTQPAHGDTLLRANGVHYLDGARLIDGADSAPLGAALAELIQEGARRVVVGVGDAAGVDGGAGLLRTLGGSDDLEVALPRAVERARSLQLVAAYREDIALLGLQGASAAAVDTLGWTGQEAQDNERRIGEFAARVCRIVPPPKDLLTGKVHALDRDPGSGAGGGVGFALSVLGAQLRSGADLFGETVDLAGHVAAADLVVVGTRIFDWRSLAHDTVATAVQAAAAAATPAIVLAERVDVGRRETMSLGASAAYPLLDAHSLRRAATLDHLPAVTALARRVAGTWSAT